MLDPGFPGADIPPSPPRPPKEVPKPPEGLPFGIIDPDYARIFTQVRCIAWSHGFSCSAQGSFTRDLDLLLVPWEEHATHDIDHLVKYIADVCGLRMQGNGGNSRPHGRKSWTLLLPGFTEVRWVDISAFPAQPSKPVDA